MDDPLDIIRKSSKRLDDDARELAEFTVKLLKSIKRDTEQKLIELAGGDVEASVQAGSINAMDKAVNEALKDAMELIKPKAYQLFQKGYESQFLSQVAQVQAFESAASSKIRTKKIDRLSLFEPRVSRSVVKASFDSSFTKLSEGLQSVKNPLKQILARGVLTGSGYDSVISEIQGNGILKGTFEQVQFSAQRIAVTETTKIYNAARYDSLTQINDSLSESEQLQYRWVALLDRRTSRRCRSLHGQVREQGQAFKASDGWTGLMPAAHPHCRSEIVANRPEWEELFRELDEQINKGNQNDDQ